MAAYRIITFDGGGVRGSLMAALVKRLTDHFPQLLDHVDLLSGTSTGSVVSLFLASGLDTNQLVEFYSQKNLKSVFSPPHLNWFRPKYSNARFRELLTEYLGDRRLGDLQYRVMAPSFQLDNRKHQDWRPVFFHNFPGSHFLDHLAVDVALSSAAAPTYFPSHEGYIDGGMMANNPSTAAIAIARGHSQPPPDLADIRLLSIGTGLTPTIIKINTTNWGEVQWMLNPFRSPSLPILNILFDGVAEADQVTSKHLLGKNYLRLNPPLAKPIMLDDWRAVPELVKTANDYDLAPTIDWIEKHWG